MSGRASIGAHGDRLALGVDPARRDHRREHLYEVAQHLEARRPRPDDDGGPQLDHRYGPLGELGPDLLTARQVLAEGARGMVAEAAQVDDAPDPGGLGGATEVLGHRAVVFGPLGR
jgi:hypothetical protein